MKSTTIEKASLTVIVVCVIAASLIISVPMLTGYISTDFGVKLIQIEAFTVIGIMCALGFNKSRELRVSKA